MQENNHSFEAYVYAISEQVEQHIAGLDELSDISVQSPLTFNQRSAAERSLQVIVEAAIGCSKHYLKSKKKRFQLKPGQVLNECMKYCRL
ncbi:MAG: hypothetical protein GY744_11115 [Gammaproteobacteria bacterium]|nr:hypothetical protein [Gammaproteobacteria bacterium]